MLLRGITRERKEGLGGGKKLRAATGEELREQTEAFPRRVSELGMAAAEAALGLEAATAVDLGFDITHGVLAGGGSFGALMLLQFSDGAEFDEAHPVGTPRFRAQPVEIILDETEDHLTVSGSLDTFYKAMAKRVRARPHIIVRRMSAPAPLLGGLRWVLWV